MRAALCFHMLCLDGVYRQDGPRLEFVPVSGPSPAELQCLVEQSAQRIGRALERQGLITRDLDSSGAEGDSAR